MKRYYYKAEWSDCVTKDYRKRGYNRLISVYEMRKDGYFRFIGDQWVTTSSYPGDRGTVCGILHEHKGYRWEHMGYELLRQRTDIVLLQLP